MPRIKIDLPDTFSFSTTIPIRITDINYGGHVGNDTILSIIHEARMHFLKSLGYKDELNIEGIGLIMSDAALEFKGELFYGDEVTVHISATSFSRVAFSLYYKLEKQKDGDHQQAIIALAKTGMVCYYYGAKKVVAIPPAFLEKLQGTAQD